MKLSSQTFNILNNFATINESLIINQGNTIRTLAPNEKLLGEAKVEESFDNQVVIYNLKQFLALVNQQAAIADNSLTDVDFEFGETAVVIRSGTAASSRIVYGEPELIVSTDKSIDLPDVVITIDLNWQTIKQALKLASVLSVEDITLQGANDGLPYLVIHDKDNPANNHTIQLTNDAVTAPLHPDTRIHFKQDVFKFMAMDYRVEISSKKIVRLSNSTVTYYTVAEADSVIGSVHDENTQ